MAIKAFGKMGKAISEVGSYHYQYVTKTATPTPSTAGFFVDMNQTSGQPKYNAFAGTQTTFTPLVGEGNAGVYVGPYESGKTKHLLTWQALNANTSANTTSPDQVFLCDYLGFYPLIDCDDLDPQIMDNTQTLTRYADGNGVRIVAIVQAPVATTASLAITYTDQDDVSRTSTFNIIAGASIGVCATGTGTASAVGAVTPFWPLAGGSSGVKKIDSVQFAASAGGFICLALVKPLASISLIEANVPVEKTFGVNDLTPPEIKSGAYLNFLIQRSGTGAGSLRSQLVFINT